ncbi:MAG: class I SAM-dependent methyltransferase [Pseudomonadota bacterium]
MSAETETRDKAPEPITEALIETGLSAAEVPLRRQVKLWARHTNEKSDVASDLMGVLRALHRAVPEDRPLRSLSIGSSDEPQFRLLSAASRGGLWLFDADSSALDVVRARIGRQMLDGVHVVEGDYTADLFSPAAARRTCAERLGNDTFDLIVLHHALYYCDATDWPSFAATLYEVMLRSPGAIHMALMSSTTTEPYTTTWLYNHFAHKFFGHRNTQNLLALQEQLAAQPLFANAQFTQRTQSVAFRCDDFFTFMAVVWMILLYPDGHPYNEAQRREITAFVAEHFWAPKRPLKQVQDYLTIHKP